MYIAYSALRDANDEIENNLTKVYSVQTNDPQLQGYLAACAKYRHEIAAIQQYIPGWVPNPPAICQPAINDSSLIKL